MNRFWIWMIPLLAAICALFLQAAVHGYHPDRFAVESATPLERPPAVTTPYAPVYPLNESNPKRILENWILPQGQGETVSQP